MYLIFFIDNWWVVKALWIYIFIVLCIAKAEGMKRKLKCTVIKVHSLPEFDLGSAYGPMSTLFKHPLAKIQEIPMLLSGATQIHLPRETIIWYTRKIDDYNLNQSITATDQIFVFSFDILGFFSLKLSVWHALLRNGLVKWTLTWSRKERSLFFLLNHVLKVRILFTAYVYCKC